MDIPLSEVPKTEFRVLGTAELKGPEGNQLLSILARPKLVALLSYLAASARRGLVRRDTLIRLFWADSDPDRARNALRQSLHHLRKSLGEDVLLTRGDDEVGLAGDMFWCDVAAFENAIQAGERETALELYRGELLEGFYIADAPDFEKWIDGRRAELRDMAATTAWTLAEESEDKDNEAAVRWARRALALAPLDEALVRRVVELLDRVGDRSVAVQEYEAFARRLKAELDLEPAPETRTLVEGIRGRRKPNGEAAAAKETAVGPAPAFAEPKHRPVTKSKAFRLGMVAGATMVIALLVVWGVTSDDSAGNPGLSPRRVLVMPFENQTGNAQLDQLGLLASDGITRSLESTGLVETVPPEAALQLQRSRVTSESGSEDARVVTLAEATNAGTVVSGTIYLVGDSLQIETLVTDVGSNRVIANIASGPAHIDEPTVAVEVIQQRVAGAIATTLDGRIGLFADALRHPPTFEAYRAFVDGQELADRGHSVEGTRRFAEAKDLYLEAFRLDTTLVAALVRAGWSAFSDNSPAEADSLAREADTRREKLTPLGAAQLDLLIAETTGDRAAALRAARRQPEAPLDLALRALWVNHPTEAVEALTEADWYPSLVRSAGLYGVERLYWFALTSSYHMLGEHEAELEAARRAKEHYPEQLDVLNLESRALAALGRFDELDESLDSIAALPPNGVWVPTPANLMAAAGFELRAHGHHEAAIRTANRSVAWYESNPHDDPNDRQRRSFIALSLYGAERWDEAANMFRELAAEYPDSVNFQGFLGAIAARRGDKEEARAIAERLAGTNDPYDFGRDTYWQACVYALLGERDLAMRLLRQSYAEGRKFNLQLHRDLDLQPLWGDRKFLDFLEPKG
jgi:serine/threonine-protein kinase